MSLYWVKMYVEILEDAKMGKLSDRLFRRTIELILIAGRHGEDGYLPPLDAIAWTLRCDAEQLETEMFNLAQHGILSQTDGRWAVTNYAKRQAPVSGNVRTQEWRKKKLKEQMSQDGDDMVTKRPVDTDTDTEKTREEEARDDFDFIQNTIEAMSGVMPGGEASIKAINELVELRATKEDMQAGYAWLTENGKKFRYYSQLVGPTKTAISIRHQKTLPQAANAGACVPAGGGKYGGTQ